MYPRDASNRGAPHGRKETKPRGGRAGVHAWGTGKHGFDSRWPPFCRRRSGSIAACGVVLAALAPPPGLDPRPRSSSSVSGPGLVLGPDLSRARASPQIRWGRTMGSYISFFGYVKDSNPINFIYFYTKITKYKWNIWGRGPTKIK